MAQSLPGWSKALHSEHASRILARLRKDYQDAEGNAYPWYSQADPLTRQAVQRAIATRDASSRALQAALSDLQGVTAFCAPLLQKQLGIDTPVAQAQYVYQATAVRQPDGIPSGPVVPSEPGEIVPKGDPQYRSLLEAALHNFEGTADTTRFYAVDNRQHVLSMFQFSLPEACAMGCLTLSQIPSLLAPHRPTHARNRPLPTTMYRTTAP